MADFDIDLAADQASQQNMRIHAQGVVTPPSDKNEEEDE